MPPPLYHARCYNPPGPASHVKRGTQPGRTSGARRRRNAGSSSPGEPRKKVTMRALVICFMPVAALLGSCGNPSTDQARPMLRPYESSSKLFVLFKPSDWKVTEDARPDSLRVLVRDPAGTSMVDFRWARSDARVSDALAALLGARKALALEHGDVALSEVFASKDGSRATAAVRWGSGAGSVAGRLYIEASAGSHSVQGYFAPSSRLAAQRSLLLNVMASFAFSKAPAAQGARAAAPAPPPPVQAALTARAAPDGSLSLRVPADWSFLAGRGRVIAASRDGGLGFIFTAFAGNPLVPQATVAQGIIPTPYQPPAETLGYVFSAFRNRQFRIHTAASDQGTARECMARMGGACDAQDFQVSYTSPEGTACVGGFKVINFPPSPITGLWNTIVAGIWGPERDFARYLPMLEQIAGSFAVNDQYARRYVQNGLENLRRLQQKTQAAMQDLNASRAQNQQDWEARQERKAFMDSGWDDYRRGHSYWVSELEGGKVYATDSGGTEDTVTGQYYE
ncbi:MAG TPA: hypothetical protein PLN93_04620, partial [Vicinamibacterales bacterium]|nr:hypothetical protein [Vicinamibacterales bacterium]